MDDKSSSDNKPELSGVYSNNPNIKEKPLILRIAEDQSDYNNENRLSIKSKKYFKSSSILGIIGALAYGFAYIWAQGIYASDSGPTQKAFEAGYGPGLLALMGMICLITAAVLAIFGVILKLISK